MNKTQFSKHARRHGEVSLIPVDDIPAKAKLVEENKSVIVGHSESGHHHVLTSTAPIRVYEYKGETYLDVSTEAKLEHLKSGSETHGSHVIAPTKFKRVIKQSFSYAQKAMRRVMD